MILVLTFVSPSGDFSLGFSLYSRVNTKESHYVRLLGRTTGLVTSKDSKFVDTDIKSKTTGLGEIKSSFQLDSNPVPLF